MDKFYRTDCDLLHHAHRQDALKAAEMWLKDNPTKTVVIYEAIDAVTLRVETLHSLVVKPIFKHAEEVAATAPAPDIKPEYVWARPKNAISQSQRKMFYNRVAGFLPQGWKDGKPVQVKLKRLQQYLPEGTKIEDYLCEAPMQAQENAKVETSMTRDPQYSHQPQMKPVTLPEGNGEFEDATMDRNKKGSFTSTLRREGDT